MACGWLCDGSGARRLFGSGSSVRYWASDARPHRHGVWTAAPGRDPAGSREQAVKRVALAVAAALAFSLGTSIGPLDSTPGRLRPTRPQRSSRGTERVSRS